MRTIIVALALLVSIPLLATPSTLIWIPSTDIQPTNVWHLGSDSYIFTNGGNLAPFVDWGLTYGLAPRVEVGVDQVSPFFNIDGTVNNPVWFNGKVQLLAPSEKLPAAFVLGVYNIGLPESANAQLFYAEGSYIFSGTRLTFGGYQGNESVLGDDNTGYLAGIDRCIGKWWVGADYQSGKNAFGAWNVGVGYALTDKIGVIVGYDQYNAPEIVGADSSFNIQFDVNL